MMLSSNLKQPYNFNFNQPLNDWNVSNVTNMRCMFYAASNFNQPLNDWNVSNVTNMDNMLSFSSFNQLLNNWNVSRCGEHLGIFNNTLSHKNKIRYRWNDGLYESATYHSIYLD